MSDFLTTEFSRSIISPFGKARRLLGGYPFIITAMLVLIAPAKKLEYLGPAMPKGSQPQFLSQTKELVTLLRSHNAKQLASLMHISQPLAELNERRYADFASTATNAKPAIYYFQGDVYKGLEVGSLAEENLPWLGDHLRILSGLYGLLRPLDLIQPYRLEMGVPLATSRGKTLYDFWGDKITRALVKDMQEVARPPLVNLASNEYFNAIHRDLLPAKPIQPVFRDYKNGVYKFIYLFARRARGLMARYIIENQLEDATDLAYFDLEGYRFSKKDSSPEQPVFLRKREAVA